MVGEYAPFLGRPIDGGPEFFGAFSNSFPTDDTFFPIGVFLDEVTSQGAIDLDQEIGINTYVSLQRHSDLALIVANGMYVILQDEWRNLNDVAWPTHSSYVLSTAWKGGWNLGDEVDLIYGPVAGFPVMQAALDDVPADGRFTFANYAKGVLMFEEDTDSQQFVNNYQDITAHDVYWLGSPYTGFNGASETYRVTQYNGGPQRSSPDMTSAETRTPANYGYMIDHIRYLDTLDSSKQPQMTFIEVGWPLSQSAEEEGRAIEPDEIKAAVLHSLIAGARGIWYFNHSFNGPSGPFEADTLNHASYTANRAAVSEINALILSLAPVLNGPFDDDYVTVSGSVRAMAKYHNFDRYVFAASKLSIYDGSHSATFTLSSGYTGSITVIGESRTVTATAGVFTDTFATGKAWHIYHIVGS